MRRNLMRWPVMVWVLLGSGWSGGMALGAEHTAVVPRKTGNLSITGYRKAFLEGRRVDPLDPLLAKPEVLLQSGMTGVEDYPTYDVIEPERGRSHLRAYVANAREARRLKLRYAIYPWVHFYPDWVESKKEFTPYATIGDGATCRQPSGWAPFTRDLYEEMYRRMSKVLGRYVDAVYVADCAEYGELGYPNGYTKWLRPDDGSKVAWWCGDDYARRDFRLEQLRTYGSLDTINARWGTRFATNDMIDYPPIELLQANAEPRKLDPQQRRWILDFVYWYQDASARRMCDFIRIAQEAFPDVPCEVKLGHADEAAMMGHSYSSACRILRGVSRLRIRSTHAAVSYFHVKRVSTPARYYGFEGFLTEPPGNVKPDRMAERIFTDACAGVTEYFDYPGNPPAAGEAFTKNIDLLDAQPALVNVAILFPEADHYLRINEHYPKGLLECATAIRDVADFDVVDERLIADGILDRYEVLIIPGDPLLEENTCLQMQTMARRRGGVALIQIVESCPELAAGCFICVGGGERQIRGRGGDPAVRRVVGKMDGTQAVKSVQTAYAAFLTDQGLEEEEINLLTARDGVWAGRFEKRVLIYNPTKETRTLAGRTLPGLGILDIKRKH